MPTDRPRDSPVRPAPRRRAGMLACVLLAAVAAAASAGARADIFLSTGPDGEDLFSDRPPLSGSATLVATTGSRPSSNSTVSSRSSAVAVPELAYAPFDATSSDEDHQPPAQAEPFKAGGNIAPGKSFTAGD